MIPHIAPLAPLGPLLLRAHPPTLYLDSLLSSSASRSSMPSVMYLMRVLGLQQSSKRMEYPT